jgi:Aldehyde dehydrogenase family
LQPFEVHAGEALAISNALPFGLAAYVYSQDLERAWAFAEKLESGSVGVNVNDLSELVCRLRSRNKAEGAISRPPASPQILLAEVAVRI